MVLISRTLPWLVSPYWLILTAFVGVNMFQSAISMIRSRPSRHPMSRWRELAFVCFKRGLPSACYFPQSWPKGGSRVHVLARQGFTDSRGVTWLRASILEIVIS